MEKLGWLRMKRGLQKYSLKTLSISSTHTIRKGYIMAEKVSDSTGNSMFRRNRKILNLIRLSMIWLLIQNKELF